MALLFVTVCQMTGCHSAEDSRSLYRQALECDAFFVEGEKQYAGGNDPSEATKSNLGVLVIYTVGLGRALGKSSRQIGDDIRFAIKTGLKNPGLSVIDKTNYCMSSVNSDDLYSGR